MSTIKQKSAIVDIEGGRRIEVKRLRWKAAREFFKKFAVLISTVYRGTATPVPDGVKQSLFETIVANLPDIVRDSDELVTLLCTQSTDLSSDDFDNLDHVSALAVLDAALAINYDDELKNCLAGIGAKLAALLPAKPTTT